MGVMRKCRNCQKPFEDNFADFPEKYCSEECYNAFIEYILDKFNDFDDF